MMVRRSAPFHWTPVALLAAVVVLGVLLHCPVPTAGYKFEDDVLVLTEGDFDHAVRDFRKLLIMFHAPWCGICRGFMKDYKKTAAMLRNENSDIVLAIVNGHTEKGLTRRFKLPGFPVVKFYKNGVAMKYSGGRGARNILNWVKAQ